MHVKSYNWAGYDATGRRFVSVRATWLQPPLQAVPSALTYASFWVGLDGDGSSTVEQTGTSRVQPERQRLLLRLV